MQISGSGGLNFQGDLTLSWLLFFSSLINNSLGVFVGICTETVFIASNFTETKLYLKNTKLYLCL